MKKVAIFASGRGSNFEHIIKSQIPCMSIEVLVTDNICNALSIANQYHIESRTFLRKNYTTKDRFDYISWVYAPFFSLVCQFISKQNHQHSSIYSSSLQREACYRTSNSRWKEDIRGECSLC